MILLIALAPPVTLACQEWRYAKLTLLEERSPVLSSQAENMQWLQLRATLSCGLNPKLKGANWHKPKLNKEDQKPPCETPPVICTSPLCT